MPVNFCNLRASFKPTALGQIKKSRVPREFTFSGMRYRTTDYVCGFLYSPAVIKADKAAGRIHVADNYMDRKEGIKFSAWGFSALSGTGLYEDVTTAKIEACVALGLFPENINDIFRDINRTEHLTLAFSDPCIRSVNALQANWFLFMSGEWVCYKQFRHHMLFLASVFIIDGDPFIVYKTKNRGNMPVSFHFEKDFDSRHLNFLDNILRSSGYLISMEVPGETNKFFWVDRVFVEGKPYFQRHWHFPPVALELPESLIEEDIDMRKRPIVAVDLPDRPEKEDLTGKKVNLAFGRSLLDFRRHGVMITVR
jgi:hypothetical protein